MDKQTIVSRIKALRLKTPANGATEAEAASAIRKVAELLAKYEITEADLTHEEVFGSIHTFICREPGIVFPTAMIVTNGIAELTDTKTWVGLDKQGRTTVFYLGLPHDCEAAIYVADIIDAAQEREWEKSPLSEGKQDFCYGMASRLIQKIQASISEKNEQSANTPSDGKALLVLKNQVIEEEFAKLVRELSMKFQKRDGFEVHNIQAYLFGRIAGSKTALNKGIRKTKVKRELLEE